MQIKILASSSKGNMSTISDGDTTIMLDCGLPWSRIQKALNFKVSSIKAVLQTHSHLDHSKGCKDMLKAGIDCYRAKSCAEELGLNGHRVHIIDPLVQFNVGTWIILPFPLIPDVPNMGFLLASGEEKAVYIVDSG
jgi:phosphoribosyl 1,2-cyclic phosphodiesterase